MILTNLLIAWATVVVTILLFIILTDKYNK